MIGAPGVGNDAGSACVVFGGAAFSEASYTFGAIGAEGSYTLIAPSDDGLGGFAVAGAGEWGSASPPFPSALRSFPVLPPSLARLVLFRQCRFDALFFHARKNIAFER